MQKQLVLVRKNLDTFLTWGEESNGLHGVEQKKRQTDPYGRKLEAETHKLK